MDQESEFMEINWIWWELWMRQPKDAIPIKALVPANQEI